MDPRLVQWLSDHRIPLDHDDYAALVVTIGIILLVGLWLFGAIMFGRKKDK